MATITRTATPVNSMSAIEEDLLFPFSPEMPKFAYRDESNINNNNNNNNNNSSISSAFLAYTVPTMKADALKIPPPRIPQPAEVRNERRFRLHELIQQRKKLEEMTDKYWLREGEISESMFESSSDEEDN